MKRNIFIFLVLIGVAFSGFAFPYKRFGVSVNVDTRDITDSNIVILIKSTIERALTQNGIDTSDGGGVFLTATLVPVSESVVEGGMRKINHNKYELVIELLHPILGVKFGTFSMMSEGAGYDKAKAQKDAVRNVDISSSQLNSFLKNSSAEINSFFDKNIDNILNMARTMGQGRDYDGALALLWSLPIDSKNDEKVTAAINSLYDKRLFEDCSSSLSAARNAFAVKDYADARAWLDEIPANSPCDAEAKQLSAQIAQTINAEIKEENQARERRKREERQSQERREMKRIDAIASIAKACYDSKRINIYHY